MAPISGAPRTCIDRIARAASSADFSGMTTSSCGSRVWSMISTDQPSGASQIVRKALPLIFILYSPLGIVGAMGMWMVWSRPQEGHDSAYHSA